MDKSHLHKIFSKAYNHSQWIEVLKDIFGANQILAKPNQIILPSNDKAKAAYELGNFKTLDDRISCIKMNWMKLFGWSAIELTDIAMPIKTVR